VESASTRPVRRAVARKQSREVALFVGASGWFGLGSSEIKASQLVKNSHRDAKFAKEVKKRRGFAEYQSFRILISGWSGLGVYGGFRSKT
jgi:hypothetical protein